jgi:ATP-dependent helicase HepA
LSREDLAFMSWDHPVVRGALDLLLGAESGNVAFGVWNGAGREAFLLEIIAVVECVAPPALHADRFLPATPVRVVVDHALVDLTDDAEVAAAKLEAGDVFRLLDRGAVKKKLLPAMHEKALALAAEKMAALVTSATEEMDAQLQNEIERLEDLRQLNDHVRPEEILALRQQRDALREALGASRLRLDALRLILQIA